MNFPRVAICPEIAITESRKFNIKIIGLMSMIGNLLRVTRSELEDYLSDSSLLEDKIYDDETENENLVDIDKSWEGIIFLLTGQSIATAEHNLVRVLFSGQVIDEEQDLGYGPAHYLTPEQVAQLNSEISAITTADLRQKFNPEKMNELEIYPSIWDEGDGAFEYIADGFLTVQNVFADATKNGEAIITFLN
jgi:Domain of unknown function (DUF1877)